MKLFGKMFGSLPTNETTERNAPPLIGYARAAPGEPTLPAQLEILRAAGCSEVFADERTTGGGPAGPQLHAALERLDSGATLMVCRLDRLYRSLPHLLDLLAKLADEGAAVRALEQDVDTTSSEPSAQTALIKALAECERVARSEKVRIGMTNARRQGVRVGRRPSLSPHQVAMARDLVAAGRLRKDVAQTFGVSLPTLRRSLRVAGDDG
ncbi:recombinase family protein (plasmid) [Acuticoccus sp. MNP-M23]|uniref:recombinase family protein n=1 Tax=Acuticoccus sp. MNP-M23 TaxID=3072793 RepID=UPI002815B5AB|nr:recombinase family protein [Acuticoccus sp. MNP-M23]WMS45308.1 recombinase family protein [Acuticoccus sp. MNP-M23]